MRRSPRELRRARDLIHEGQLQDALVILNQIDRKTVDRPPILAEIQYYTAYSQVKMALSTGDELTPVSVAMFNFLNDNAESYHHFEAVEILGDLAMALGKYSGAVRYYSRLGTAPWPELQMRGALLEARRCAATPSGPRRWPSTRRCSQTSSPRPRPIGRKTWPE